MKKNQRFWIQLSEEWWADQLRGYRKKFLLKQTIKIFMIFESRIVKTWENATLCTSESWLLHTTWWWPPINPKILPTYSDTTTNTLMHGNQRPNFFLVSKYTERIFFWCKWETSPPKRLADAIHLQILYCSCFLLLLLTCSFNSLVLGKLPRYLRIW